MRYVSCIKISPRTLRGTERGKGGNLVNGELGNLKWSLSSLRTLPTAGEVLRLPAPLPHTGARLLRGTAHNLLRYRCRDESESMPLERPGDERLGVGSCLTEAANHDTCTTTLRELFITSLRHCDVGDPFSLLRGHRDSLVKDLLHHTYGSLSRDVRRVSQPRPPSCRSLPSYLRLRRCGLPPSVPFPPFPVRLAARDRRGDGRAQP